MAQPARWTEQALLLIIQVIKAFSTGATFIMTDTPIHVFLSHGLESGPGSTKIQAMKAEAETFPGIQAHAIDHSSTRDPATRLAQMREAMAECNAKPENTILAGSSMGAGSAHRHPRKRLFWDASCWRQPWRWPGIPNPAR